MRSVVAFICLALLATMGSARVAPGKIQNFVVVMMENRAFDHMLGYMNTINPEIRGLTGNEFNLEDPSNPNSKKIYVNPNAHYVAADPAHSIDETSRQVFGSVQGNRVNPPPMNGFAASAKAINIDTSVPLSCFNPKTLPIMSTLASEFALFDAFYAAVPGPTEVNRMYMHSASSQGMGFNDLSRLLLGFPGRTIYHNVQDAGYTWNSYVDPVASSWVFTELRNTRYVNNYRAMPTFHADCKAGKLANYNFIEPRYFSLPLFPANDQHPSHSVAEGERLLKNIYESIRNSPQWNTTALIITYDEHGGFYDHMPTPVAGVPNPDNINSTKPPFDFKRLGVRIPMIVASPWIPKGLVVHEAGPAQMPTATSQYDTTSILATVKKMFGLPNFLTKRDAWASSFENIFSLNAPRSDCPTKLPAVPTQFFAKDLTTEPTQPLNDLQKTWITLGAALHGRSVNADEIPSEQEGGKLLEHFVKTYWEKDF